jgi:hypothetical protein
MAYDSPTDFKNYQRVMSAENARLKDRVRLLRETLERLVTADEDNCADRIDAEALLKETD